MQFFHNRYAQLAVLTLGIGLVFWVLIWLILTGLGVDGFPVFLQVAASFLGAGVLVAKVFAGRVF